MRASDLIGADVVDRDGRHLGVVTDLRCVQDGPLRGAMATPRITALLVSRRHTGSLLGYDRRRQQGPWLVRLVVRRLHRHLVEIPWAAVASYDRRIALSARAADITGGAGVGGPRWGTNGHGRR